VEVRLLPEKVVIRFIIFITIRYLVTIRQRLFVCGVLTKNVKAPPLEEHKGKLLRAILN
jgi:hypothetical protein